MNKDLGRPRKPRAIRLDEPQHMATSNEKKARSGRRKPRAEKDLSLLVAVPDEAAQTLLGNEHEAIADMLTPKPATKTKGRFSFGKILLAALTALLSLATALAIDQLVRELFTRNEWLGWVALGLTIIVIVAALGLALREFRGLIRARTIGKFRQLATDTLANGSPQNAGKLVDGLMDLYQSRPDTARGRAKMESLHGEIIDAADLVKLAERDLVGPLDLKAREMVMSAAKRVSVVTAISPRALVDLAYVAYENLRLIRHLSELYGGRPGTLGIWKLARNVIAHLAVTGSIAVGDSIIQQFVGQGLAAKLSSRLGEGVVNGLLTARVGISAIDLCRPMPFIALSRPGIGDFIGDLVSGNESNKNKK